MNNLQKTLVETFEKGYRVRNGIAYRHDGYAMSSIKDRNGYLFFKPTKNTPVYIHRLVAYEKYEDQIFDPNIEVRHLDGNLKNNNHDNISLGDHSRNMMDQPKEQRIARAKHASSFRRKFTDEQEQEIKEYYNYTKSYKETMGEFGITSKGTLHYILRK